MGPDPGRAASPPRGAAEERPIISRHCSTGLVEAGFDRFDLRPELRRAVADAGFTEPRPIQTRALPPALAGRDVLGLAQTGTGKTAAFALPILQRLLERPPRRGGPRALIVAPTRELASQIQAEVALLARHTRVTTAAVFGGVPIPRQVRELRARPDVVVACPGRLLDLLARRALDLGGVEVLVLDEADHMFDMGFLPDVRRILAALPRRRQNLLFSATMPPEIRKLADQVLDGPEAIDLGNSRPAETIAHALFPVREADKLGTLEVLLCAADFRSAIVFLRTKHRVKRLARRLVEGGHSAVALQGNMSQPQRERALRGFREQRFAVLVATDIAARGLDVTGVSHVINFDVPNTPDAYTHRIGRTGRSDREGTAFTFVTPDDAGAVAMIEKRLGARIERRDATTGSRGAAPGRDRGRDERRPAEPAHGARGRRVRRDPGGNPRTGRSRRGSGSAREQSRSERPAAVPSRGARDARGPSSPACAERTFGWGVRDAGDPPRDTTSGRGTRRRRRRRVG